MGWLPRRLSIRDGRFVLSSFYRDELAELRRVSIGPDLVFGRLWQNAGCRDIIAALLWLVAASTSMSSGRSISPFFTV